MVVQTLVIFYTAAANEVSKLLETNYHVCRLADNATRVSLIGRQSPRQGRMNDNTQVSWRISDPMPANVSVS